MPWGGHRRRGEYTEVIHLLRKLGERLRHVEQELQNLTDQVTQLTDVSLSVVTMLDQLGQMMRDAADDPAQVRALADQVGQIKQGLADAVTRNTAADPGTGGGGPTS